MEQRQHNRPGAEELPPIPAKRYFTIGEVSELCRVKPHVLRYWEQEFTQLKSVVKRRGNRRYYQHHEVLLVRRIRELLYSQCFTISGARNRLEEELLNRTAPESGEAPANPLSVAQIRAELEDILQMIDGTADSLRPVLPSVQAAAVAAKATKTASRPFVPPENSPESPSEGDLLPATPELFSAGNAANKIA